METTRVVEVLHDRGHLFSPRWLLGSGFIVKAGIVLTAAHNLGESLEERGPEGTFIRSLDGDEYPASTVARSDVADIALLAVPGVAAKPVRIARIDRGRIDVVRNVMAVGFPNYKYAQVRPPASRRQPAQPVGSIPTVEDFSSGDLTLKVEAGEPAAVQSLGASPWEGLSGAGVVVGDFLVGVVIEHHLAEGLGALRVVPVTRVAEYAAADGALMCAVLGIDDPVELPTIDDDGPESDEDIPASLVRELKHLRTLSELGLLGPGELKSLRITAVKEAKGWR